MNPCRVDGQVFRSEAAAAKHMGVNVTSIRYHLDRGTLDSLVKGGSAQKPQPCVFDGVWYPSQAAAAAAVGVSQQAISLRLNPQRRRELRRKRTAAE